MRFAFRSFGAVRPALLLIVFSAGGLWAAEPAPDHPPAQSDERKPVPMTPEAFHDFVGRYQREDMTVAVFRDHAHFFLMVDDRPRAELFPLSDHEFFLHESPDTISFERDAHGKVTHFIRHSTAPQLFVRLP